MRLFKLGRMWVDFYLSVVLGIDAGLRINISLTKHFIHNFATPLNRFTVPNSIYNWEIIGEEGWESSLVSITLPSLLPHFWA